MAAEEGAPDIDSISAGLSGAPFSAPAPRSDFPSGPPAHRKHQSKGDFMSQAKRRATELKRQRSARRDVLNYARGLVAGALQEDEDGQDDDDEVASVADENMAGPAPTDEMVVSKELKSLEKIRRFKNQKRKIGGMDMRGHIMMAEWLESIPRDLRENWLVIPCPVGKRCIVTTDRGSTVSRHRRGRQIKTFPSTLPAGNYNNQAGNKYTVLDCIFVPAQKTFYVLDIMCWNGMLLYNTPIDFRISFRDSRLSEVPVSVTSKLNRYPFIPLAPFNCDPEGIVAALESPLPFARDGLLFYHKNANYTLGRTATACWLSAENVVPKFASYVETGELPPAAAGEEMIDVAGEGEAEGEAMVEVAPDARIIVDDELPAERDGVPVDRNTGMGMWQEA